MASKEGFSPSDFFSMNRQELEQFSADTKLIAPYFGRAPYTLYKNGEIVATPAEMYPNGLNLTDNENNDQSKQQT